MAHLINLGGGGGGSLVAAGLFFSMASTRLLSTSEGILYAWITKIGGQLLFKFHAFSDALFPSPVMECASYGKHHESNFLIACLACPERTPHLKGLGWVRARFNHIYVLSKLCQIGMSECIDTRCVLEFSHWVRRFIFNTFIQRAIKTELTKSAPSTSSFQS